MIKVVDKTNTNYDDNKEYLAFEGRMAINK